MLGSLLATKEYATRRQERIGSLGEYLVGSYSSEHGLYLRRKTAGTNEGDVIALSRITESVARRRLLPYPV